jgi:hypothetical protein
METTSSMIEMEMPRWFLIGPSGVMGPARRCWGQVAYNRQLPPVLAQTATAKTSTPHEGADTCASAQWDTWAIPTSTTGARVSYFVFFPYIPLLSKKLYVACNSLCTQFF